MLWAIIFLVSLSILLCVLLVMSNKESYLKYKDWPEDMFSRSRLVSPGFYTTTGWYTSPRHRKQYFPRSEWARKSFNYYYINN